MRDARLAARKFVIPNPFGPFEEPRFRSLSDEHLAQGRDGQVHTPLYVRDNIHVDLLAMAYRRFAEAARRPALCAHQPERLRREPGRVCERVARESAAPRPASRNELRIRQFLGTHDAREHDPAACGSSGWRESEAWDRLADYYRATA